MTVWVKVSWWNIWTGVGGGQEAAADELTDRGKQQLRRTEVWHSSPRCLLLLTAGAEQHRAERKMKRKAYLLHRAFSLSTALRHRLSFLKRKSRPPHQKHPCWFFFFYRREKAAVVNRARIRLLKSPKCAADKIRSLCPCRTPGSFCFGCSRHVCPPPTAAPPAPLCSLLALSPFFSSTSRGAVTARGLALARSRTP